MYLICIVCVMIMKIGSLKMIIVKSPNVQKLINIQKLKPPRRRIILLRNQKKDLLKANRDNHVLIRGQRKNQAFECQNLT